MRTSLAPRGALQGPLGGPIPVQYTCASAPPRLQDGKLVAHYVTAFAQAAKLASRAGGAPQPASKGVFSASHPVQVAVIAEEGAKALYVCKGSHRLDALCRLLGEGGVPSGEIVWVASRVVKSETDAQEQALHAANEAVGYRPYLPTELLRFAKHAAEIAAKQGGCADGAGSQQALRKLCDSVRTILRGGKTREDWLKAGGGGMWSDGRLNAVIAGPVTAVPFGEQRSQKLKHLNTLLRAVLHLVRPPEQHRTLRGALWGSRPSLSDAPAGGRGVRRRPRSSSSPGG